jgi:hypothetical protein
MDDPNASVFNMTDFTITRRIVQCYLDDVRIPINDGAASGDRITGLDFLNGIQPGQEQIIIHSGDQSIHIDKTQWVRILERRDTEVGQKELYVNHAKYNHQVFGPYIHKHHDKTIEAHVLETKVDYYGHVKVKEHVGDTRIRNIEETIIITGTQHTEFNGKRSLYIKGTDSKQVDGGDMKGVNGTDTKVVYGLDSAYALFKNAITFMDMKGSLYEQKWFGVQGDIGLFLADVKAGLLRTGVMCAKAVGTAIGSIRF